MLYLYHIKASGDFVHKVFLTLYDQYCEIPYYKMNIMIAVEEVVKTVRVFSCLSQVKAKCFKLFLLIKTERKLFSQAVML